MQAVIVYESVWGNTAAVARAIAAGYGAEAKVFTTDDVPGDAVAAADLIVAGSPVFAFSLPTEAMRENILRTEADAATPPDLSHPSLRSWLDTLPEGSTSFAAFETRIWWSPRGATGTIEKRLARLGYRQVAKAEKFVVGDKYGPLREGEIERARAWGRTLRELAEAQPPKPTVVAA